jgi:UDP-N-acetylglucosamine--N-acetylmuramyl-(pentapeptide) pyrophosphoryl-undecaprenol N-acetylglucosamine transferase
MANGSPLKVLLVAEGSGGHLIPALQTARSLAAAGARIKMWYALRQQTAALSQVLMDETNAAIDMDPIPLARSRGTLERLWRCGQLWRRAERCFNTFAPDVVVGFGGWVSAPVVLAAKRRGIGCILHEQNVVMGRANRWLIPWVDRVAVSFRATQAALNGRTSVVTGLPVRGRIGRLPRAEAAQRLGMNPRHFTLLVLGGSQGSRAVNRLMVRLLPLLTSDERRTWQMLHVAGGEDAGRLQAAYDAAGIAARSLPFLAEMDAAYAVADAALGRSGASTVAELARCGLPAILIPYPHASGHQRANARAVESAGGGFLIEEADATPERLLNAVRWLAADAGLRERMGTQVRRLNEPDAAERLTRAIVEVAHARQMVR